MCTQEGRCGVYLSSRKHIFSKGGDVTSTEVVCFVATEAGVISILDRP